MLIIYGTYVWVDTYIHMHMHYVDSGILYFSIINKQNGTTSLLPGVRMSTTTLILKLNSYTHTYIYVEIETMQRNVTGLKAWFRILPCTYIILWSLTQLCVSWIDSKHFVLIGKTNKEQINLMVRNYL